LEKIPWDREKIPRILGKIPGDLEKIPEDLRKILGFGGKFSDFSEFCRRATLTFQKSGDLNLWSTPQ